MKNLASLLPILAALLTIIGLVSSCSDGSSSSHSDPPTMAALTDPQGTARPTATATAGSANAHSGQATADEEATRPAATRQAPVTSSSSTASITPFPSPSPTQSPFAVVQGALVRVTMDSQVGVLLDDFPASMRQRVIDELLQQPDEAWLDRARRQIRLSRLRLNYRDSVRPGRGQLPLPQPELWSITLHPAGPSRQTIQTHDLVMIGYTLTTTILTDAPSVKASEPTLAEVGGDWEEPFLFPADPDMLLQRTGRACLDDDGFPPNSVDSENAWHFYDFAVRACHETLAYRVGVVETSMRFERLPWDAALADQVRTGPITSEEGPDLVVVGDDLRNNRIVYRYFEPGDCALEEGAVGAGGWRRLLRFEATVLNGGTEALHLGPVRISDNNGAFEYAPCHEHVHYRYYGDFTLHNQGQLISSKQAFCVQSTDRLSNNELSPLNHDYSCRHQGIQSGWVDEYIAGLDTQWVDITDLEIPADGETYDLGFIANPNRFLCEGTPVLDEDDQPSWEPSGLTTEDGDPINRPQCNFISDWDQNNEEEREVFLPVTGSFVTAPCQNGEVGPRRNCGFSEITVEGVDAVCRARQPARLSLQLAQEGPPQVIRVCERSAALGAGVACTYGDSLANVVLEGGATDVTFTCPPVRDAGEADGDDSGANYSLYAAPLWPSDEPVPLETGE